MAPVLDELHRYRELLEGLPFVRDAELKLVPSTRTRVFDVIATLDTPTEPATFHAVVKRSHLTSSLAEQLASYPKRHLATELLVLAPSVGREIGDLFVRVGIHYMDLAGNCHIRVGDRYLAHVQGQRAPKRAIADKTLRAPALRVLFALLANPKLVTATTRQLAAAAGGVSPQTASDVSKRLISAGIFVQSRGTIRWAPGARQPAIELLVTGIPVLTSSTLIHRFRTTMDQRVLTDHLARGLDPLELRWRWGGGIASERLTGFYRSDRTIVYVDTNSSVSLRPLMRPPLIPDPNGDVTFAAAPGPLAFQSPIETVVHPLLAYLDLLAEGNERAREAAGELHRRYLGEQSA